MPAVANLVGTGEHERIRRGFWLAMRLLVPITLPLVAGVAVTGPALLRLAYGEEYADAGPVLLAMLAPLLLQPMLRVSEGILYGLGRVKFIVIAGLVATVVDLALAFALIPSLDAIGAAIANGAAILVAGVPCLVLAVQLHRPVDLPVGPLLRAVLRRAGRRRRGLGGAAARDACCAVVTGTLAFFAAALILRPLAADDAAWLAGGLGEHGAARHRRRLRAQNWRVIDLHSHLLPGLDDGPADVAGSVALAAEVAATGVRTLAATPHLRADFPDVRRARARAAGGRRCRRGCTRSGSRSSSSAAARSTCCGRRARPTRSCAPRATAAAAPTCWSRRPTASCRGCSRTCCSGSACAGSGSCSRTRSATRPSSATRRGSCGWSRATCSCSSPPAR